MKQLPSLELAGWLLILLGCAIIASWSSVPGLVWLTTAATEPMRLSTASCFTLLGASIVVGRDQLLSRFFALAVYLLSLASLIGHLWERPVVAAENFGMGRHAALTGRMALETSICFLLVLSVFMFNGSMRRLSGAVLAITSIIVIASFAYTALGDNSVRTSMAYTTALGFAVVILGLLRGAPSQEHERRHGVDRRKPSSAV